ncbi:hypothetical protein AURDEDRAFT_166954 [Auricularia subglabra TFB-10046 SS5]|nr:hypothetical protein AURDEDRAFT_166954 [Auricularia subglabra TFB-10046 SS5]
MSQLIRETHLLVAQQLPEAVIHRLLHQDSDVWYIRHPTLYFAPTDGYIPGPLRNAATESPSVSLRSQAAHHPPKPLNIQLIAKRLVAIARLERRFASIQGHRTLSSERTTQLCELLNELDSVDSHGSQTVRSVRRRLVQRVHTALGSSSPVSARTVVEGLGVILDLERRFERVLELPSQTRRVHLGNILRTLESNAIPSDGDPNVLRHRRLLVRRVLGVLGDRRIAPELDTLATARTLNALAGIERQLQRLLQRPQPVAVAPFLDALRAQVAKLAPIRTAGVNEVKMARAQVRRHIGEAFRRAQSVPFARQETPASARSAEQRSRARRPAHNAAPSGGTARHSPAVSARPAPFDVPHYLQPLHPFPVTPVMVSRHLAPGIAATRSPPPPPTLPWPSHAHRSVPYFRPAAVPLFPAPPMSHARVHGSVRAFHGRADEVPKTSYSYTAFSPRYTPSLARSEVVFSGAPLGNYYEETIGSLSDSDWEDLVSDMDGSTNSKSV